MKTLETKICDMWTNTEKAIAATRATALAVERAAITLREEVLSDTDISITATCVTLENIINPARIVELFPIRNMIEAVYESNLIAGFSTAHYIAMDSSGTRFEIKINSNALVRE